MSSPDGLVRAVRRGLAELGDPQRAPGMQAYMKSSMPYRGVAGPLQHRLHREVFERHPLGGRDDWIRAILELWRKARFREERYAAIALSGHRLYRAYQAPDLMPVYEELIVTGAWWDYVDAVAIHRVGPLVGSHPAELKPAMRKWSTSQDLWKRRTAIICQVAAKGRTDLDLLYACVEPNLGNREFFIRKAIGWALRSYAWIDPGEVERYVATVDDRISGLSRREALRNIAKIRAGAGKAAR